MFKNISSQVIGVQMVGTDGTAFTGTATAYVTLGTGTQGTGAGTISHKGNGYHLYLPTQGETNADHIGYTFVASGCVPATVQVVTADKEAQDRLTAGAKALAYGVCGNGTTPTTSFIPITGGSGAINPAVGDSDQFKGRILNFLADTATTGLRGQGAPIFSVTTAGITLGTATAGDQTLSRAPSNGDTFAIS